MGVQIKRAEPTPPPEVKCAVVAGVYSNQAIHVRQHTCEHSVVFAVGTYTDGGKEKDQWLVPGFEELAGSGYIKVSLEDASAFARAILEVVAANKAKTF